MDRKILVYVFIFIIALHSGNDAIRAVKLKKKPQYIIITGESGSGKTVTTNHLTQYLSSDDMVDKAARIGKILDLFGNCETPLNYNSSRFVKILQVKHEVFLVTCFKLSKIESLH